MPPRLLWLFLLVIVSGCATARATAPASTLPPPRAVVPPPSTPRPPVPGPEEFEQTGLASWYGRQHHGRRTASGETYDMNGLTAAHRTLPLGTRVRVTNLDNGRTVDVRINDRGPFAGNRLIDLSYAAASRLGAIGTGLFRVGLRTLGSDAAADR
jgi:rare lipoprotein A (peptidoglycan hydrolase)